MQTGEQEVRLFCFDGVGEKARRGQGIEFRGGGVQFDMDGAVGAFGQSFADGLGGLRRTGAQNHHFAAKLFTQLQRFFQRIGVGFVHFVAEIRFVKPVAGGVGAKCGIPRRDLLD